MKTKRNRVAVVQRNRITGLLDRNREGHIQMNPKMNHLKSTASAIGTVLAMLVGNLHAQQVPIPQTAAEVRGPALGPMTKAYVQMVGRTAYLWGWPLVYVYNQRTELTKVPEVGLLAGVMPSAR